MNKYAKFAVQSTNTEQAQQNQRSRGSTNYPSTSAALLSPEKPSTSSSWKSIKRRRIRRTVADSARERAAQKNQTRRRSRRRRLWIDRTPGNDSDSATIEKTKTKMARLHRLKKKNWKLSLKVKVQHCLAVYRIQKRNENCHEVNWNSFRYGAYIYKISNSSSQNTTLKLIVFDINEVLLNDLAYVVKIADYNKILNILWLQWIACPAIYVHNQWNQIIPPQPRKHSNKW